MDFIDLSGRGKERPLSYSTIEKTFYSFFVYQEVLETPLDYRMEDGENPRDLERRQILRLMNLIAQEIYIRAPRTMTLWRRDRELARDRRAFSRTI